MQVNSAYTAYSLPIETRYNNDIKAEKSEKTASTNQDTVSISLEARARADQDQSLTPNNKTDPVNNYSNGSIAASKEMTFMEKVKQALMDQRTGLDREKIEEIEEAMEIIMNDPSIPAEQKAEMLQKLEEEIKAEFEKAAEKMAEQVKKEAIQPTEHLE